MSQFHLMSTLLSNFILFYCAHQAFGAPDNRIEFFHKDPIIQLTDSNFNSMVLDSGSNWVITFYAPWCRHSKNFASTWFDAAEILKKMNKTKDVELRIGAFDCVKNKIVCDRFVEGYPSVYVFPNGDEKEKVLLDHDVDSSQEILSATFDVISQIHFKNEYEIGDTVLMLTEFSDEVDTNTEFTTQTSTFDQVKIIKDNENELQITDTKSY